MWFFDGYAWPGWHDYLGLLLAVAGFFFALYQLKLARNEVTKARTSIEEATAALNTAQSELSERAMMALAPQMQSIASDLTFAMTDNDVEVGHRALLRFSHVAREAANVVRDIDGSDSQLAVRFEKASRKATKAKGELHTVATPIVVDVAQDIILEIERLSVDLGAKASAMRNTIKGASIV